MNGQNAMQVFSFEGRQVRTVMVDGEPWWVLKDVCDILEYHDANSAARLLDDDEKGTQKMRTPGGMQDMTTINEPGLFKLILRSNKAEAKIFQRFVTHEVLPALRKHGEYATPSKQREKARKHDEAAMKLLDIMEKDANRRMAKVILEGIDKFNGEMTRETKTMLMARYAELAAGEDMIRAAQAASGKWYTATEIGAMFGMTPAMIGTIANEIGLKAPYGENDEYGAWIRVKPRHSSKEIIMWVYSEKSVEWFRDFFGVKNMA